MSQETFASLPGHSEKEENVHGSEVNRVQSETSTLLDPHDPLNWSWRKKHLVLGAICYMTFMTDFFVRLRGSNDCFSSSRLGY